MFQKARNETAAGLIVIEPLKVERIGEIIKIEEECGFAQTEFNELEKQISEEFTILNIALINKQTIGYISARLITSIVEIDNVAVSPKTRRCGIGAKLLGSVISYAAQNGFEEIWLEVRESNAAAINLYLTHNFKIVGKRLNYYSAPIENAVLMNLKVADKSKKMNFELDSGK